MHFFCKSPIGHGRHHRFERPGPSGHPFRLPLRRRGRKAGTDLRVRRPEVRGPPSARAETRTATRSSRPWAISWAATTHTPSPGTIYPTLTMLEDIELDRPRALEGGRKEYRISAEGRANSEEQREAVERILAHLEQVRNRAHGRRLPEIMRAMENLKMALRMRLGDDLPDPAVARRISEIIDRAAVEIERC